MTALARHVGNVTYAWPCHATSVTYVSITLVGHACSVTSPRQRVGHRYQRDGFALAQPVTLIAMTYAWLSSFSLFDPLQL